MRKSIGVTKCESMFMVANSMNRMSENPCHVRAMLRAWLADIDFPVTGVPAWNAAAQFDELDYLIRLVIRSMSFSWKT